MAQVIDAEQLKKMRKRLGLTQDELAAKAGVNKQTVYRLERRNRPARKRSLEGLAQGLAVDREVLTGAKPIPLDASQGSASADEIGYYQLNVRVDAPIRNSFELVARRYGVSIAKIAQIAPLLFVILAEASLEHRRKKLDEFQAEFGRISDLAADLHLHLHLDLDGMEAEKESIERRDLFGRERMAYRNDEGNSNPFVSFLQAVTAASDDISISAIGPTSTEYRVCHLEATELAGGDKKAAGWLLNGEVPIHRMPRGLKTVTERVEWIMGQNRISTIHKAKEEIPEGFPGDLVPINLNLDDFSSRL